MAAPAGGKKPKTALLIVLVCVATLSFALGQRLRASHALSHPPPSPVSLITDGTSRQPRHNHHRSQGDDVMLVHVKPNVDANATPFRLHGPANADNWKRHGGVGSASRQVAMPVRMRILIRTTTPAATELALGTWLQSGGLHSGAPSTSSGGSNVSIDAALLLPETVSRSVVAKLVHQQRNATMPVVDLLRLRDDQNHRGGGRAGPPWGSVLDRLCVEMALTAEGVPTQSTSMPPRIDYWVLTWDTVLLSVHAIARYLPRTWSPDGAIAILGGLTASHHDHTEDVPAVMMTRHAVDLYCAYRRTPPPPRGTTSPPSECAHPTQPFTTCLPAAGVTLLNHRGIVGTTGQDLTTTPFDQHHSTQRAASQGGSKRISNVLAVAGLSPLRWPYFNYFLNRFYSIPRAA